MGSRCAGWTLLLILSLNVSSFQSIPIARANGAGQDFKVIRGTKVISSGSASATITQGTDYTLESGQNNSTCFIRITNTRLTGMGKTSGGGTQNTADTTVRIDNPENVATSITFTRLSTTDDCRVDWEIIQYVGSAGGPNEFKVRATGDVASGANDQTVDGAAISTIANINKAVCFITGQASNHDASGDWWEALWTAQLVQSGSNYIPRFSRGKAGAGYSGYISYAVVEFTGSNWRNIQRFEITTKAPAWQVGSSALSYYTDVSFSSLGGNDLLDSSKAFLHVQYRTDNDATGLDDAGDNVEIVNNSYLRIRNRATSGNRWKVVWVVENTQAGLGRMSVQHVVFYDDTTSGSEERQWSYTITQVSSVDRTSIMGECASVDGTGTAYPRGSINVRLTATNTVTLTESDCGQERIVTFDVVQWPSAQAGVPEFPIGAVPSISIAAIVYLFARRRSPSRRCVRTTVLLA